MKLRSMAIAGAVSFALSPAVFAEQHEQGADQDRSMMQQEQSRQPQGAHGAAQSSQANNPQVVKEVQKKLNDEGYAAGPADGIWGPKTQRALQNYQQAKGIQASGQLDEETLSELDIDAQEIGGEQRGAAGAAGNEGTAQDPTQQQPQSGEQEPGQTQSE